MGRMYTGEFNGAAVSAVQDIFQIGAPSDAIVVIHEIRITQDTEEGDAAAEMFEILANRFVSPGVNGSGGAALTARPLQSGDAAFGGTYEQDNTTVMSGGTATVVFRESFNVQVGFFWTPPPPAQLILSPDQFFVVSTVETPTDAIDFVGTITFEEIGG